MFDAQVAFEIACKVSWLTALMKVCVMSWWLVVFQLMSNSYCILDAEMNSIGGAVYIE